jgi:hypothetical protein
MMQTNLLLLMIGLAAIGMFWLLRPGRFRGPATDPSKSRMFLQDETGWIIGLGLALFALLTAGAAIGTDDFEFRLAMLGFTGFGSAMAAAELGRRIMHSRRLSRQQP